MPVRIATPSDIEDWVALRARLWPGTSQAVHREEAAALLEAMPVNGCVFVHDDGRGPFAFSEATLRRDHVNGCETSPVAFLEGIYVAPDHRREGVGALLLDAVRAWARERGCTELASDAHIDNIASHAFHRTLGFEETVRVVCFRTKL